MQITQVTIENFRGHLKTILDVSKYHALVGENGTGKTSILDAIHMATSTRFSSSKISEHDFNDQDGGDISITVEFDRYFVCKVPDGYVDQHVPCRQVNLHVKRRQQAGGGRPLSEPFVISHTCVPTSFGDRIMLAEGLLPAGVKLQQFPMKLEKLIDGYRLGRKNGNPMDIRPDMISVRNELIGFPEVELLGRKREIQARQGFGTIFSRICSDLNWRLRKNVDLTESLALWEPYNDHNLNAVEDQKSGKILRPIREETKRLLGDAFSDLEISMLDLEQPFDGAFLSLRKGLNQIPLEGLGSGVAMVISICMMEQVAKMTDSPLILLIDEPELHLHPQLQKSLSNKFRVDPNQIIISTHSPFFVDLGTWHGITRISKEGKVLPNKLSTERIVNGRAIGHHLESLVLTRKHQTALFESDAELLFARRVLLVEGPVEKHSLFYLASVLEVDLGELAIVSCNSKDKMYMYAYICHAFDIQAFALFDLDGESTSSARNARLLESLENIPSYSFARSFECEFGTESMRDKAGATLNMIANIDSADKIPQNVVLAIKSIAKWSQSL